MSEFCQKLKAKGFVELGKYNTICAFSGDFTGRDVTVVVGATDNGEQVLGLMVYLPASGEWNTLVSDYTNYKELYIKSTASHCCVKKKIQRMTIRILH